MEHIIVNGLQSKECDEFSILKKPSETWIAKITRLLHLSSACNCLCTLTAVVFIIFVILICKTYVKALLIWLSYQDTVLVNFMFIVLFTLVSFPFLWGYMLLVLSSGYLFGILKGLLTVIFSANVGIAIAHYTIRSFHKKYPICKLERNEHAQAVLRVIGGPQAFKIVLFCRLSPIPFGLQSTIFALSNVRSRVFHIASFIGLLPAQCLATYLGSTLRSMEDVLSDQSHATTGVVVLSIQVVCGIALLLYIVHKARQELKQALLLQSSESSSTEALTSIAIS